MKELWLNSYNFNMARIIHAVEDMVEAQGGVFVTEYPAIMDIELTKIHNRSVLDKIKKTEDFISRLHMFGKNAESYENELEELKKIKTVCIVNNLLYVHFVLGDRNYYFSANDNPFFDFYISSSPLINRQTDKEIKGRAYLGDVEGYYSTVDKKEWLPQNPYDWSLSDEDVRKCADKLFKTILSTPTGHKYTTQTRKIIALKREKGI